MAKALLREARECGASLLITGAYSHSQGSDMLFGGNTQVLVDEVETVAVPGGAHRRHRPPLTGQLCGEIAHHIGDDRSYWCAGIVVEIDVRP